MLISFNDRRRASHPLAFGATVMSSSMIAKMGVGRRGDAPEVSPLLSAEDGRAGTESTRDTRGTQEETRRQSGWLASSGARVGAAALVAVLVLATVVGAATGGSFALSGRDVSSVRAVETKHDAKHQHARSKGVDLLPEVFVVTGEDADGPTGKWLRVSEEEKTEMEAKALKKLEAKSTKKFGKATHGTKASSTTHHKHGAASTSADLGVSDLDTPDLEISDGDADKLNKYKSERAFQDALEADGKSDSNAFSKDLDDSENAVHVVQHPTTAAQRAELANLRKQEENMVEVEKEERLWAAQVKAAEEVEAAKRDGAADVPDAGEQETQMALSIEDFTSKDLSATVALHHVEEAPEQPVVDTGGSTATWSDVDLDPSKASCVSSLKESDGVVFDAARWFDPLRADGDPGNRGDFGPRARAIRDTTFVSSLYPGVPGEDVLSLVQAAKDTACNAGRSRLNTYFFAESDQLCRFVKSHYVAGRSASESAGSNGPTESDPASPMPRLGGGRFQCVVRASSALPLQPPRTPLAGAPYDSELAGVCSNANAAAAWYNKANFVVEAADASRKGTIPITGNYAWVDFDQAGAGLLKSLLEHPYDVMSMEKMPTRVHFKCHSEQRRKSFEKDPCRARAGFVAPKLFVGSEFAMRSFAKKWSAYAQSYVPLESTKDEWRYAKGFFNDYSKINHEDLTEETPLIETPIVANGETGAWSCPCPSEDFFVNRLWNDELFPDERERDAISEEAVNWGNSNEAVAAVGGGFKLAPGLALIGHTLEKPSGMGKISIASLGTYMNNDPARNWDVDHVEAENLVTEAANLAGEAIRQEYAESEGDDVPLMESSWARRETFPEQAERLAVEAVEHRESVATTPDTPPVRTHVAPEVNKLGNLVDALEDARDGSCARVQTKPTSFAELPSMGLRKWHF